MMIHRNINQTILGHLINHLFKILYKLMEVVIQMQTLKLNMIKLIQQASQLLKMIKISIDIRMKIMNLIKKKIVQEY